MDGEQAFAHQRGKGQPWLFVVEATVIAASAEMMRQVMAWLLGRSRLPRGLPPPPPIESWLTLYRRHRSLADGIGAGVGLTEDVSASELADALRELSRMPEDARRAEMEGLSREEMEAIVRPFIGVPFPPDDTTVATIVKELGSENEDEEQAEEFESLLESAEGQFYFRVWLPCWCLYHEYPPRLLRKARQGDDDALEKLLRLDKSIVIDPVIARRWHEVMHSGSKRERDRLLDAMKGRPKGRLDAKAMRYQLGGLISQMAKLFRCEVTAPEIAELFDAVERVRSGEIDVNIPRDEALTRALHRHRSWPSLPS